MEISNEQATLMCELMINLTEALEKMAHIKVSEICTEDEIDKLYLKSCVNSDMTYELAIYNTESKAKVIKTFDFINLLGLLQDASIAQTFITMEVTELYNKSKEKVFKDDTEILLN